MDEKTRRVRVPGPGPLNQMRRRTIIALLSTGFIGACGGGSSAGGGATTNVSCSADRLNPVLMASPEGDAIVLSSKDPNNPLSLVRVAVTKRIQKLAQDLSCGADTPIDIVERFMTYIDGFAVGVPSENVPDVIVKERVGACGEYSNVLLALVASLGFHGRHVNFYNYPVNDGHTVVEIYINDSWILFDPTNHVYYSTTSNGSGQLLSYEEIGTRYKAGQPVYRIGQNTRAGRDSYSGPDIFLRADPQGIIGPAYPMWFPLGLSLTGKSKLSTFDAANQGSSYLGAAAANVEQYWRLSGLTINSTYEFEMESAWLGGDFTPDDNGLFEVDVSVTGGTLNGPARYSLDFNHGGDANLKISFIALGPAVEVRLAHPYRGPQYRYVVPAAYSLAIAGSATALADPELLAARRAAANVDLRIRSGLNVSPVFFNRRVR